MPPPTPLLPRSLHLPLSAPLSRPALVSSLPSLSPIQPADRSYSASRRQACSSPPLEPCPSSTSRRRSSGRPALPLHLWPAWPRSRVRGKETRAACLEQAQDPATTEIDLARASRGGDGAAGRCGATLTKGGALALGFKACFC